MGDPVSPELPPRKEYGTSAPWQEIRSHYRHSKFNEMYQLAMKQFEKWEASPRTIVEEAVWNQAIEGQMQKAKEMVGKNRPSANIIEDKDKVAAIGRELPLFGIEDSTRIYLGVDPRKSADAFIAFLDELEANGVLKDVNVAINLEALRGKQITGNMIIVYDPMSRLEVLDRVLKAYRNARASNPEAFALTDRQKAAIMRWNLRHFHATIDVNMSFVEQPKIGAPSKTVRSFDEVDALRIQGQFNLDPNTFFTTHGREYTDEEFLQAIKARERMEVFTWEDQERIRTGFVNPGDVLRTDRKLSAPAIVQRGAITAKGAETQVPEKTFPTTRIPDNSIVTSQIRVQSQVVGVDYDELKDYLEEFRQQTEGGISLLQKAAAITVSNLQEGIGKWEAIAKTGVDTQYTLGQCIKEGVNSCFQRAIFFNLLMQKAGIPSRVQQGVWVESERGDLSDADPIKVAGAFGEKQKLTTEDKYQEHLWNLVRLGEDYYLVDTSYSVNDQPVIKKVDFQDVQADSKIQVDGKFRHYLPQGEIEISAKGPAL